MTTFFRELLPSDTTFRECGIAGAEMVRCPRPLSGAGFSTTMTATSAPIPTSFLGESGVAPQEPASPSHPTSFLGESVAQWFSSVLPQPTGLQLIFGEPFCCERHYLQVLLLVVVTLFGIITSFHLGSLALNDLRSRQRHELLFFLSGASLSFLVYLGLFLGFVPHAKIRNGKEKSAFPAMLVLWFGHVLALYGFVLFWAPRGRSSKIGFWGTMPYLMRGLMVWSIVFGAAIFLVILESWRWQVLVVTLGAAFVVVARTELEIAYSQGGIRYELGKEVLTKDNIHNFSFHPRFEINNGLQPEDAPWSYDAKGSGAVYNEIQLSTYASAAIAGLLICSHMFFRDFSSLANLDLIVYIVADLGRQVGLFCSSPHLFPEFPAVLDCVEVEFLIYATRRSCSCSRIVGKIFFDHHSLIRRSTISLIVPPPSFPSSCCTRANENVRKRLVAAPRPRVEDPLRRRIRPETTRTTTSGAVVIRPPSASTSGTGTGFFHTFGQCVWKRWESIWQRHWYTAVPRCRVHYFGAAVVHLQRAPVVWLRRLLQRVAPLCRYQRHVPRYGTSDHVRRWSTTGSATSVTEFENDEESPSREQEHRRARAAAGSTLGREIVRAAGPSGLVPSVSDGSLASGGATPSESLLDEGTGPDASPGPGLFMRELNLSPDVEGRRRESSGFEGYRSQGSGTPPLELVEGLVRSPVRQLSRDESLLGTPTSPQGRDRATPRGGRDRATPRTPRERDSRATGASLTSSQDAHTPREDHRTARRKQKAAARERSTSRSSLERVGGTPVNIGAGSRFQLLESGAESYSIASVREGGGSSPDGAANDPQDDIEPEPRGVAGPGRVEEHFIGSARQSPDLTKDSTVFSTAGEGSSGVEDRFTLNDSAPAAPAASDAATPANDAAAPASDAATAANDAATPASDAATPANDASVGTNDAAESSSHRPNMFYTERERTPPPAGADSDLGSLYVTPVDSDGGSLYVVESVEQDLLQQVLAGMIPAAQEEGDASSVDFRSAIEQSDGDWYGERLWSRFEQISFRKSTICVESGIAGRH